MLTKLNEFIDSLAPSPQSRIQRDASAVREACCGLLMEVARLDNANAEQKRGLVAQMMREQFEIPDADLSAMIDQAGRLENRLTSYFDPVKRINRRFEPHRKAQFVEQLWRVAMVDGDIDMYEDHLVRKLADLLYVPHNDFILAKNRVRAPRRPGELAPLQGGPAG
ncbi:MAG: TerB family tellurite resistance protein [Gallionellaceae bacterium]|nr:TerB family tellurite resistance protein [Gallionellaceae bacterium]MDD5365122.1 TerB family tellurite resistance protein [Gallionellaceae bacterium]